MKKKFKRVVTSALVIMMFLGVGAFSFVKVKAASITEVFVNGVNISYAPRNTVACGSGSATYDSATQTLTLNNATVDKVNLYNRAIDIKGTALISVDLIGVNTITGAIDGMHSESDLTIKGPGSLEIHTTQTGSAPAIMTGGDLTIEDVNINTSITSQSSGISSGAMIKLKNANVRSKATGASFLAEAGITITNSTMIADSSSANANGVYVLNGNLSINGNSNVTSTSSYPALWAQNIDIIDSIVSANSTADTAIWTPGTLAIKGNSEITAKGATGSLGGKTAATITPITGKSVGVWTGNEESDAVLIEGSPFNSETDLNALNVKASLYFHSKTHEEKVAIIAGAGFTHQVKAGKDMTLTCTGKLEDLTGIYVDGTLLDPSNYTLVSGSTILTLKASYLDTLSVGNHSLKFQYKNNLSADTSFTITKATPSAPETGDLSNTSLFLALMMLSSGIVIFKFKKKYTFNK